MINIKEIIKKIIYRERSSSESYVNFLREKGCEIGEGTRFFDPRGTEVDITKPSLITIGKNVQITAGVKIITHGFDWFVLNGVYGDILGSSGEIIIGNNVFIGVNTLILKGVTIGDNVIIGAGSLVNRDIPECVVAAGNPIRVISSIEDYYIKRKNVQLDEAFILYKSYVKRFRITPPKSYFHEFFWLFEQSSNGIFDVKEFNYEMNIGNRFKTTMEKFTSSERLFSSYEQFCKYCDGRLNTNHD